MRRQLDKLKCEDGTPWTSVAVVRKGPRRLEIVPRQPRAPVEPTELFPERAGRQRKRQNPYSQVWSFLARFEQIDTPAVTPFLPVDIRREALLQFREVTGIYSPRDYNQFTIDLGDNVNAFALMVALAKEYYASLYYIVGLSLSRDTYVGCGDLEHAGPIQAKMTTIYQRRCMPHFYTAAAWAKFNGTAIFEAPYGQAIMLAWLSAFYEKSVERIDQRRSRNVNQRLHLQQKNINFQQLVQFPEMLPSVLNFELRTYGNVVMPAPLPYALDGRPLTTWQRYLNPTQKHILGGERFVYAQHQYFSAPARPSAAVFRASVHGQQSY
jgi:hypothetical protein